MTNFPSCVQGEYLQGGWISLILAFFILIHWKFCHIGKSILDESNNKKTKRYLPLIMQDSLVRPF